MTPSRQRPQPPDPSSDGVIITDRGGRISSLNPLARQLTGWSTAQALGRPLAEVFQLLQPSSDQAPPPQLPQALAQGSGLQLNDLLLLQATGERLVITASASPLEDEQGQPSGMVLVFREQRAAYQVQQALEDNQRTLATLMSNLPGMAYRCRLEPGWTMEFVSKGCLPLTGYSAQELSFSSTVSFGELIHPEDRQGVWEGVTRAVAAHQPFQLEYRISCADGREKWVWEQGQGVFAPGTDEPRHLEGFITDITALKKADETRQLHELILSSTDDLMSFVDNNHVYRFVNDAYLKAFGLKREQILDHSVEELVGPEVYHEIIKPKLDRALKGELVRYETSIDFPDIGPRIQSISYHPFTNAQGETRGVVVVSNDVTSIKQATAEKDRLMSAIEQASEVIMITDSQGVIQYVNPAFSRLTGYSRAEAIGTTPNLLKSGAHHPDYYQDLWQTLLAGRTWEGHFSNRKKDGTIFEEEATISPVKNSQGLITNFVAVKRDVTRERALEEQLRQATKMEAIGTLTGGIAHDFNNILAVIIGYAELIQMRVPPESATNRNLEHLLNAGARATDLVQQLLTFSRQTDHSSQEIPGHLLVRESIKMLRATLPSSIRIEEDLPDCGTVRANPTNIQQIVLNLCTNAVQSMADDKGDLRIRLRRQQLNAADIPPGQEALPGPFMVLTVEDSGAGIAPQDMARIFEPYFTTKPIGKGTGLGLSVVHGLVSDCKGFISVESRLKQGTTFHVFLPAGSGEGVPASRLPVQLVPEQSASPQTILLVDDEEMLVTINQLRLEKAGYLVEAFTRPTEALSAFHREPERFSLLITDQTMPEMGGLELSQAMLAIKPSLPIILCTGYSATVSPELALQAGVQQYLCKPLNTSELLTAVQKALRPS
ncbi:hybrid sensor histidine kinase/response regulator [Desulfogranum mediterraneum]|uniref:hybrid sensor histidine kinase/response regulator n=1 Tax=Desulfogranum mediterraneum TaxID=160661 RepID=UPI00041BDEEA|nr:PAS domain S-box protein [Desulfogranum mediterraneum]